MRSEELKQIVQRFEHAVGVHHAGTPATIETGVVRALPVKKVAGASRANTPAQALTLLRSGKRSERIGAARDLGDYTMATGRRIPEAVVPLAITLATDIDEGVREESAWSLWKLGDPRAHKALIEALLKDASSPVREKCARALGLMGARESLSVMLDLLTLDRHVPGRVRAGIACAFGYLADESLLLHLIRLSKDAEPRVRYEAVRSLGRYLVGFGPDISERVFDMLCRYVRKGAEPSGLIRKAAVKALRFSSRREAAAVVARVLHVDSDAETRQTAAEALLIWDQPSSESALIGALEDDCWQVRKAAARSLSKFIVRYRVYDSAAVCEALRRIERMLPAHSLEWRLAADAFASL
jgi:HEAT repeat protein